MKKIKEGLKVFSKNKKAYFDYEIKETIDAGIVLMGTEISSIVKKNVNFQLQGSFITIHNGKLVLLNSHIPKVDSPYSHEAERPRDLLVTKSEKRDIVSELKVRGITLVPLMAYIDYDKSPKMKLKIAIVRGRKDHDKREYIKERDSKRIEKL